MELSIDPNSITLDELDELSEAFPEAAAMLLEGKMSPKVLKGFAWIIQRRTDPTFTVEDAGKLTLADFAGDNPKDVTGPEG